MGIPAERVPVLLLAYGGPASLDEVGGFLRRIMAPREPSEETVARAVARYRQIGGASPLVANTLLQARLLQERLDAMTATGSAAAALEFEVIPGMRHTEPTLASAVRLAAEASDGQILTVVMASHQSERATGAYMRDVQAAFDALPSALREAVSAPVAVRPWHTSVSFVRAVAARVREAVAAFGDVGQEDVNIVFTAHSLPLVGGSGDPVYEEALDLTARQVASLVGEYEWTFAYQSASPARGAIWLGPAVEDVVSSLAASGRKRLVVAPLGFVSEHLETLYDLDVELARRAREAGVTMVRAATVHDSPLFIEALATAVASSAEAHTAVPKDPGNGR